MKPEQMSKEYLANQAESVIVNQDEPSNNEKAGKGRANQARSRKEKRRYNKNS